MLPEVQLDAGCAAGGDVGHGQEGRIMSWCVGHNQEDRNQ